MEKTKDELLLEANEIIRTFNSIIERCGADTNWNGLDLQVKRILKEQHSVVNKIRRKEKIKNINGENN